MRIEVVTLFAAMFDAVRGQGVTGRAIQNGQVALNYWNPRDFTHDRHRTVDDRPFGGGPGMVMLYKPLTEAVQAAKAQCAGPVVYLSPQGRRLDQSLVQELAQAPGMILVCGRYEGVDERFIEEHVDLEVSIGDYVLSGGELGAMVLIDAVARLLPGVLGHSESAEQDSFAQGLLDCPHYTRPEQIGENTVPPVLLSGDHQAIARWRLKQALGRTWLRRPDLLEGRALTTAEQKLLDEFIAEQK